VRTPNEQAVHPTGADHIQIADAVRAGHQAADDRGQLRCRVGRTGSDQFAGEVHMLVQQIRQAGLLGQFQHRDQPCARPALSFTALLRQGRRQKVSHLLLKQQRLTAHADSRLG
jgi:hypothetical protein